MAFEGSPAASSTPTAIQQAAAPSTSRATVAPTPPPTPVPTTPRPTTPAPTPPPTPVPTTPTVTWTTTAPAGLSIINGQTDGMDFEMVQPFDNYLQRPVRRLEELSEDEEGESGHFDRFTVHITAPMDYELTEELLQELIDRKAFNIQDGREDELGPISIKSFKLQRSVAERNAAHFAAMKEQVDLQHPSMLSMEVPALGDDPALEEGVGGTTAKVVNMTTALAAFAVAVLGVAALVNMRSACRPQSPGSPARYRPNALSVSNEQRHYYSVACELSPTAPTE